MVRYPVDTTPLVGMTMPHFSFPKVTYVPLHALKSRNSFVRRYRDARHMSHVILPVFSIFFLFSFGRLLGCLHIDPGFSCTDFSVILLHGIYVASQRWQMSYFFILLMYFYWFKLYNFSYNLFQWKLSKYIFILVAIWYVSLTRETLCRGFEKGTGYEDYNHT